MFGGRRARYGNLTRLATGPPADRLAPSSTMVGVGITPEAVEMSPISFDLIFEMGWRSEPPAVASWVSDWAVRRYGGASPSLDAAWAVLRVTNYNEYYDYGKTTQFCVLCDAPQLTYTDTSDRITQPDGATQALRLFIAAVDGGEVNASLSSFRNDLVDVARQVCAVRQGTEEGVACPSR